MESVTYCVIPSRVMYALGTHRSAATMLVLQHVILKYCNLIAILLYSNFLKLVYLIMLFFEHINNIIIFIF